MSGPIVRTLAYWSGRPAVRSLRVVALLSIVALGIGAQPISAAASTAGLIRVDQVGYLPGDAKQAYLMVHAPVADVAFAVVDTGGRIVRSGHVSGASRGAWNDRYQAVYPITFTDLRTPGTYHIVVSGGATGRSPAFRVADAPSLYRQAIADGVAFYQVQRDGPDVIPGP